MTQPDTNLFGEELPPPPEQGKAWDYHRQPDGKDEWLTPPEIIQAIGPFDLDPCAPIVRPWGTAKHHYTIQDNGLLKSWHGRVWCNPPYRQAKEFLARCKDHDNAIALVFAGTETEMFFDHVWDTAHSVFFFKGRLTFLHVDGSKPKFTGGAGSCLISWNIANTFRIMKAMEKNKLEGKLIEL